MMEVGNSDALILPVPPEPFALIVGAALRTATPDRLETMIRHMGLRPERADAVDPPVAARIAGDRFRLTLGAVSVVAGKAASPALDMADPVHPSTSLMAPRLPRSWRDGGQCWVFIPEGGASPSDAADISARMREFFKMMVLLIDLFEASHVFWSPARLWSEGQQFRASVAEMLLSGMPPVLHLVAFRRRDEADGPVVATRGLTLFSDGQELEARIPDGWTVAEMVKRLARIALDIMLNGPVVGRQNLRGLHPGERIVLQPIHHRDGGRSMVRVEFGGGD